MFIHATLLEVDTRRLDDILDDLLVDGPDLIVRHLVRAYEDSSSAIAEVRGLVIDGGLRCSKKGWNATTESERDEISKRR
jgi:hypothetical protein